MEKTLLFDKWEFCLTDQEEPKLEKLSTCAWRPVKLPHDWSTDYPFDRMADTNGSGGYAKAGIGWYRRKLQITRKKQSRNLLYFEGIYRNSTIYLNGKKIGGHIYGYTPFEIDITEEALEGANELLIVVDNSRQPGSRWYSGSGITRDVWQETRPELYIARYGVYITTYLREKEAGLQIETTLHSIEKPKAKSVRVKYQLLDEAGNQVTLTAGLVEAETVVTDDWRKDTGEGKILDGKDNRGEDPLWYNRTEIMMPVKNPVRWTVEKPVLYQVVVSLYEEDCLIEKRIEPVGFRTASFDANRGFLLNGEQVKLNGVCLHHDGGSVGAAVPPAIWKRRLEKLKNMGVNSIRCSHNPPDVALLALCDQMGFLVMDEAFDEWEQMKDKAAGTNTHESHGYSAYFKQCHEWDMKTMLYRDRNHPSIILWSIGNEVPEQNLPGGEELVKELRDICHTIDPTRRITQANDQIAAEPCPARQEFLEELDVVGYNYAGRWRERAESFYDEDHQRYPHRCVIGTENPSAGYVRGEYKFEENAFSIWEKPYYAAPVSAGKLLRYTMTHDFVAGDYMWTGIDYLGESQWPKRSAGCGCLDTCGFEKDSFYFYKSVWKPEEKFAYLCPHWNLQIEIGRIIPVICYTSCHDAELFLNGKSYGKKSKHYPCYGMTEIYGHFDKQLRPANTDDLFLTWDVPYEPGRIEVIGYEQGEEVCQYVVETTGAPVAIQALTDTDTLQADGRGVAQIEVRLVDDEGRTVPVADNKLQISLQGEGRILGIDNGRPDCHEQWKSTERTAFHGLLFVIVQAGESEETMKLRITGENLEEAEVMLRIEKGEKDE